MILTENSIINNNLSAVEECTGDPFEYISNASYACAYMEAQINFSAICAEYAYLRENGVEAICEANIIVSIFTAIKNAIVKTFNAIASFFKSICTKSASSTNNIKKKLNTIDSNNSADDIDLEGFTYIQYNISSNFPRIYFSDVTNIDDYVDEVTHQMDIITRTIKDSSNPRLLVKSPFIKQEIKEAKDELNQILNNLNVGLNEYKEVFKNIESAEAKDPQEYITVLKDNNICRCELHVFNKCKAKEVLAFAKSQTDKYKNMEKVLHDGFEKSKTCLDKYKKQVDMAETAALQLLSEVSSNIDDNTKYISNFITTMASAMNSLISGCDYMVTEFNRLVGKIISHQLLVLSNLTQKITTLTVQ